MKNNYQQNSYNNYNDKPITSAETERFKMYVPSTKWTWAFFTVILLQAIIGIALEAYIFGQFQAQVHPEASNPDGATQDTYTRAIPCQLALLIFGFLYQLVLTYDALKNQNTIQVIGLTLMNCAMVIYTGIQYKQVYDAFQKLNDASYIPAAYWTEVKGPLIALPVLIGVFGMILAFLSWQLYQEFGWKIYKQIGADPRMKRRFLLYQIYITLLKFDFFFFIGFAIQFLVVVHGTAKYEEVLTAIALPIVIFLLLLAAWSASRENVACTVISMFFYGVAMAYFVFKLVRMYHAPAERLEEYAYARNTLSTFAVITILLVFVTIFVCIWVWTNYNHGLIEHTDSRRRRGVQVQPKQDLFMDEYGRSAPVNGQQHQQQQQQQLPDTRPPAGSRMEID